MQGAQILRNEAYFGTPQLDRECTRKPRLAGGVKGHTIMKRFLTGKLRPVGGELHFLRSHHFCF